MDVLAEIVSNKRLEVEERKSLYPVKLLESSPYYAAKPVSMKTYLEREDQVGIIAEFKRKSPSKGLINEFSKVEPTTIGYMQSGASGLSILTDSKYFGGTSEDLTVARTFNFCPILRKDFIIDEYQIIEAKSIGADLILLIASILSKSQIAKFTTLAQDLGMEVLLEIHNEAELTKSNDNIDILGVNNRNLKTFETSTDTSKDLAKVIPSGVLKISESGLSSAKSIMDLMDHGYNGFLIGESFMHHSNPSRACGDLIREIKSFNSPS